MEEDTLSAISPSPVLKSKEIERQGLHSGSKNSKSQCWHSSISKRNAFNTAYHLRDNAGTCLIIFSIPLFIPGVTLTAVAFEDETGFAKYSVLHIMGMIMLALAAVLVLVGIILIIKIGHKVAPEYPTEHPPRSVSTHHRNRLPSQESQKSDDEVGRKGSSSVMTPPQMVPGPTSSPACTVVPTVAHVTSAPPKNTIPPSNYPKTPVNFMIELGHGQTAESQSLQDGYPKPSTVGSLPPIIAAQTQLANRLEAYPSNNAFDGYSSSPDDDDYDSDYLDSDDHTSGSYVISGENAAFHHSNEEIYRNDFTPETSVIAEPGPCKTSFSSRSKLTLDLPQSRNFFFDEDIHDSLVTDNKIKVPLSINSRPASLDANQYSSSLHIQNESNGENDVTHRQNIECGINNVNNDNDNNNNNNSNNDNERKVKDSQFKLPNKPVIFSHPSPSGSPRQRLEAFSNASALASSMQMRGSEELLPENIVGEMSESNGSVFTGDEAETGTTDDVSNMKCPSADDVVHMKKTTSPLMKTFTYDFDFTTQQNSGVTGASGSANRNSPKNEEQFTSSPKSIDQTNSSQDDQKTNGGKDDLSSHDDTITNTNTLFSTAATIRNQMNSNTNVAPTTTTTTTSSNNSPNQWRHSAPVPLKTKKKRASFAHREGDDTLDITYYE